MKLLILNNLSSGLQDGGIFDFTRMVSQAGDEVTIRSVDQHAHFAESLADAKSFDCVVAAGGDGTIASVNYELRYSGVPVLIYPAGTANLIAENILHPMEPAALAKLVREGKTMDFDLGELDFGEQKIGFMMIAGCGYDAKIMSDARDTKQRLGAVAYFKAALENPNPQVSTMTMKFDDTCVSLEGVGVLAMNFSRIQFDVPVGTENLPRDGLLDVALLKAQSAWELLPAALGAAFDHSGKPLQDSDALHYFRGQEFSIDAQPPMNVQYDGEATELTTPFTVRALPGAAKLLVTQECLDIFG